jgi:hypothetical protein
VALRDFLLQQEPLAVIFWHSAANGVFAAGCPDVHEPSLALANIYGQAAGYPVYEKFNSYPITGDAGDWLTTQGIASISIELKTHQSLDWSQNLAGIVAIGGKRENLRIQAFLSWTPGWQSITVSSTFSSTGCSFSRR